MRYCSALVIFALVLGACLLLAADRSGMADEAAVEANFQQQVLPLVKKYCEGCHGEKQQIAGVSLHQYPSEESVLAARDIWEKVAENLKSGNMPPRGLPQPGDAERALIVEWVEGKLNDVDCNIPQPGRVTIRRLNRLEYNNTVRDLLGVAFRPADDFPSDDVGYGFDNIGDVLTLSPLHLEKYLNAAEQVSAAAIFSEDADAEIKRFRGHELQAHDSASGQGEGGTVLYSNGELRAAFEAPAAGEYLVRVRAHGQQAGPDPAKMAIRLDGAELLSTDVVAVADDPQLFIARTRLEPGQKTVAAAFLNDYYNPEEQNRRNRDRNLVVHFIDVVGPLAPLPAELPEAHRKLFVPRGENETDDAYARRVLGDFARRAYRRPVSPEELDRLAGYVELARREGDSLETGVQLAVQAALVSPHFLFRVELDPRDAEAKPRDLNAFELANRLSYFLWSSMPDEALFSLAEQGELKKPAVLQSQVRRMLRHANARALVDSFATQWLQLRNLAQFSPDPARYPGFSEELRADMQQETELFFETIMKEDRPVTEFLDGRFTFLNERLANHYGIKNVKGEQFRRVTLRGNQRRGVLTHASILTITSNPTRTSPVKRGKWVLEQILGTPPPPPPPDVDELEEEGDGMLHGTLRQRMEQHRKDPICNSCHERMDTIGFGLENFDAIGAWRSKDGPHPIDATGTLPGGESFDGPAELVAILKKQQDQFIRNFTTQLMTFGLGRGLEHYDRCAVDEVTEKVAKQRYRFSALVTEIVNSDPFQKRSGDQGGSE
jgi:hypothetical protein